MKLLLIILLTMSQAFAIDVTPVKKGDPSPKDGFFVDTENMKKFREINEKKKNLEKQVVTLEDLGVINEERIKIHKTMLSNTEREVSKERTKGNLKGLGGFILGVLATSVAAYAAIRVSKWALHYTLKIPTQDIT